MHSELLDHRWMSSRALFSPALALAVVLFSLPLFSQTTTGRILGSVRDQTDAAVVGATVSVTDVQRGITRALTTDQAGEYAAPNLTPGVYTVRAEAKGFKIAERQGITLEVAKDIRVDLILQPGEASETVTVTEDAPLLETTNAVLGGTLSNRTINDLPLNGRNYQNLLQLRPGVMIQPGGGGWTQSSNGVRPEDNIYMVDGLNDDEPFSGLSVINGAPLAGDASTVLPIDAIQEFNVQENPSAEYGWKPGAIVNVGLKSGTNTLHGTAYGFGRTDSWDARNYFNTTDQPKIPLSLEQFGGTVGGPIVKDKLFFFGGYEGQQYTVGNIFVNTVPVAGSLGGNPGKSIADALTGLQAHGIAPSPVSRQVSKMFPVNPGPTTDFSMGYPSDNTERNALGKIDYHVNSRHTLNGMYFFGQDDGMMMDAPPELQPQFLTRIHTRAQVASGNWVWTPSSNLVNEARIGFNHLYQPTRTADMNVNPTAYGLNTGVTDPLYFGMPQVQVKGFTRLGGLGWPKTQGPDNVIQFVDHISYLRGKHALKFGGELLCRTRVITPCKTLRLAVEPALIIVF